MKRTTQYGLGFITVVIMIALIIARDRILDLTLGKLPNWLAMTLMFGMIISVIALVAWQQSKVKQPRSTHCAKCGYDLRATPDRCPECGTIPPEKRKRP